MKLILILLICCWIFIQLIQSRQYRMSIDDELYPYSVDKSVPSYLEYFSQENFEIEQIDDDTVRMNGYGLCTKSMDPVLPLQIAVHTQYLENSIWREGPVRLLLPDVCAEFLNPPRFWYNVTKLWSNCPPKKGDKWVIEDQIVNILVEAPPSFSKGPWKGYMLLTQGLFGATHKFGIMIKVELIEAIKTY